MTVRALIDLNAVPLRGDQIVAALGAFHVVLLALALGGSLLRSRPLLPQQVGVPPREVLVFVLTRLVRHEPVGDGDGGGVGGGVGLIFSVSPPGVGVGTRPGGDDDSPE